MYTHFTYMCTCYIYIYIYYNINKHMYKCNTNLKNKIASFLTSKIDLFRKSRQL